MDAWARRTNQALRDLIEWCDGSLPRDERDRDIVSILLGEISAEA